MAARNQQRSNGRLAMSAVLQAVHGRINDLDSHLQVAVSQ
jgi:hypothetical protein